jgi:amino acid adenylation domain-containing protein
LFDVVFVLQNIEVEPAGIPGAQTTGLQLKPYSYTTDISKFDLTLTAMEAETSIHFTIEYCTRLFKEETIRRIIGYFKKIVSIITTTTTGPGKKLLEIDILSEEEKTRLLYDFNDTEAEYPKDKTLQRLFEEQVERTPDNIAVTGSPRIEHMTYMTYTSYRELNQKSNQLAHLLRQKSIKPDTIVGIMMQRSLEMIIGILGILKAGGAYLPIDPDYPGERQQYMLEDSGAKILVTVPGSRVKAEVEERFIEIIDISNLSSFSTLTLTLTLTSTCQVSPTNLAYIIYTSGTTGKPKGVLVEHKNVVRLLFNDEFQFDFNSRDVWTLFHSFCFDFSVWEMYGALLYGGKVVIIPKMTARDPGEFLEILKKHNVTVLNQTPSAFYNLINLESTEPGKPLRLKYVIFGGEALIPGKLNAWRARYPAARLVNMYGITETTVHVTYKEIEQQDITNNISNIGTPIPTLFTYAMARHLKLSPRGVAGELCIGGEGLGRGYLNRPQLTHEKFVQNPYKPGERLYLSGDLVRLLENGEMEYLGRIDQQVQLRGFRIEPGEIEYRLLTHPQIKEAVVLTRQDEKEDKYLGAYIVSADPTGKIPGASQLRDYLAKDLPDYMVPAFFIPIQAIPLTSNGKIDRKALPKPEVIPGTVYIAPRDMIEKRLTEIWADILDLDKNVVSMDADFFELGGHSLKATILIGRIHKELDVKIPLVNIFKTPTIRGLARIIKDTSPEKFLAIPAVEKRDYYTLSSAQKRLYILQQMNPSNTSYNLPMVLSLEGNLDENRFEKTLKTLIQRHESLRTSFQLVGDEPRQRIHDGVEFEIENDRSLVNDHRTLVNCQGRGEVPSPIKVEKIIRNFIHPFDLSCAPLLRVGLIKLPHTPTALRAHPSPEGKEDRYLLMVDMHHIITDGTSLEIFAREFMALYEEVTLPGISIQYKDFSQWQDKIFAAGFRKTQQEYWQREFQGEIPVLELPYDFERPVVMSFEGNTLGFEIDAEETQRLKDLSLKENTTLFMKLLAILYVFLAKISSQENIVIGTPIAGRRHTDLQWLIGVFINTLALKNYPNGEKSFKNFLQEVKNRTLKSYENQEYPFEDLVEKVVLARDTGRNPLFDVMFVFQNIDVRWNDIPEIETRGLNLKPYQYKTGRSKFDMNFTAAEIENRLFFRLEYCTKLFREATIKRFINSIKKIIHRIIINPGIQLGQIEILSEEEKQGILFEFNETETQYPENKSIHQLFDEQVELTPDHIAVLGMAPGIGTRFIASGPGKPDLCITYRELNRKSNQLAHLLRQQGVKPNSILGIMGQPSLDMLIGILGILKSGGAYLPLNPGYPRERIRFMLEDSSVRWLITRKAFVEAASDQYKYEIIDPEVPGLFKGEGENLTIVNHPGDLAYVIYTSGSTGKPKGVMIQQQSLVNYVCWGKKQYIDGDHYIFPLYTTLSFDLTVTSVFLPLLSGNRIMIYQGEENLLPIREIAGDGFVDIVKLTPSHLRIFPGNMNERSHSIKTFIVGGEQLESGLARDIHRRFHGNLRVYNEYGPTEATVGCMIYKYDYESDQVGPVPIGIPIDNARIYILDEYLHPVPFNVIGGIYIGGDTLARGYLDRPELTAERFLKNPFVPGESIYKTGDLARRLPNGNIEFLGRMDEQVKIRGFRIEPGEIENRLLTHEHIKEVVVVKENSGADFYLSAYIVPNSPGLSNSFSVSALREYLLGELPEYMLPSRFIQLDHIPLTSNGKVDKKALALLGTRLGTGEEYVAPQNEIEKKIARIWQDILELDKISINDNFFELGGTSLKLIRVNTRLKEKFSRHIPVVVLFRYPTIRLLTRYLNQKADEDALTGNQRVEEINKGKYKMKNLKQKMRAMEND